MSEVTVSGPTQVIRAGQSSAALTSATWSIASSIPRTICPTGPASGGAGVPWTASVPTSVAATAPAGSGDRTTIGRAPPDQARSTSRRTRGWPIVSASAPSSVADRMIAATVMPGC